MNNNELEKYALEDPGNVENVLEWWRDAASRYPKLSLVARKILAVPASSSANESVFSVAELLNHGLRPDAIDIVVTTHGHPDHYGNLNLFSRKRQFFSSFEYAGNKFSRTALAESQSRKLTDNVEVWKTPGHTPEDLSVIVRNVPHYGVVAVAGDLILHEDLLGHQDQWTNTGSWDVNVQKQSLTTILCMVDWIIPGHGPMFKVTDEYRKQFNCSNSTNSRHFRQ